MWLDQVFRKGHRQRYSMSVRGGTDDIGYFVSGAWNDNVGAVETDGEQKMNVRANVTFSPTEDLMLQFNNTFARTDITQAQMGNSVTSIMMSAIRGPKNYMAGRRDQETLRLLLNGEEYRNVITRATTGLTINYTPGADFTHRLTVGYDYSQDDHFNSQDYCWLCPIGIMSDFSDYKIEGEGRRGMSQNGIWSLDYTGSLGLDLGWLTDGLRSTVSFGMQGVENEIENSEMVGRNYPGPGVYTLSSAATKQNMTQNRLRVITGGFFAQNMLAFQDKYFVTAGLRVDGNSAFGESLGFELYPKLSGSYVLSDEGFFPEGLGKSNFGQHMVSPVGPLVRSTKFVLGAQLGLTTTSKRSIQTISEMVDLGPERTREYEYGMDGSWFGGRFSAEVTYYHQLTSDALFRVASSQTQGGWANSSKTLENLRIKAGKSVPTRPSSTVRISVGTLALACRRTTVRF